LELFLGCLWRLFASRAARAVPLGPQRRPPRVDGRRCKRPRVLEAVDPTVAIPYVSILLLAAPTLAEQCLVDTGDAGVDADLTPVPDDQLQPVDQLRLAGSRAGIDLELDRLAVRDEPDPVAVGLGVAGLVQVLVRELDVVLGVLGGHLLVVELRVLAGCHL